MTYVTGLIYVVIIGLWAAVLIPIWLRRHDQISEVRSTARFSSAMKSLGNPGQVRYASDGYFTDASLMETQRLDRPTGDRREPSREARMPRPTNDRPSEGMDPNYERELVRQAAATRRAVVLGILTLVLVAALLLAVVGILPRWVPIAAAAPVIAFVVAAAMTASHRTSARSSRSSAAPRTSRPSDGAAAPAVDVDDDWENWNAWDDDEDSWDAVPTTLPTYVSAPRASAVPRPIDKAHPREWNGEAMVETAQAMRSRRHSDPLASPADVDHGAATAEIPAVREDAERRRAANE